MHMLIEKVVKVAFMLIPIALFGQIETRYNWKHPIHSRIELDSVQSSLINSEVLFFVTQLQPHQIQTVEQRVNLILNNHDLFKDGDTVLTLVFNSFRYHAQSPKKNTRPSDRIAIYRIRPDDSLIFICQLNICSKIKPRHLIHLRKYRYRFIPGNQTDISIEIPKESTYSLLEVSEYTNKTVHIDLRGRHESEVISWSKGIIQGSYIKTFKPLVNGLCKTI